MIKTLHMNDEQYEWLLTIYYIPYIIFQVLLITYKFARASILMSGFVLLWGIAAMLQAAAFNWQGMMAARFFIGLSEAGFCAGIALYLSFFYAREEIGRRFASFVVGSAFASAVGGSLAYAIQSQEKHMSIDSWRVLFLVEAAPTALMSLLLLFILPDSIQTARFLNEDERNIAEARLYRSVLDKMERIERIHSIDRKSNVGRIIASHFDMRNGLEALRDPISYLNAAMLFLINVGFSAVPVYLPQILNDMGYTRLRAQAFSAPPYAASFLLALLITYIADKTHRRYIYLTSMNVLGIIGYLILATAKNNHVRYSAIWLVVLGLFPSIPLLYSWLLVNTNGESKKGVKLVIFGTIGQCGPLLGTRLFPASEKPYYRRGMFVNAALLIAGVVVQTVAVLYLFWWNKRKQQFFNAVKEQQTATADPLRPLRFERRIDLNTKAGQDEMHMRRQDIALYGEQSIYYTYQL